MKLKWWTLIGSDAYYDAAGMRSERLRWWLAADATAERRQTDYQALTVGETWLFWTYYSLGIATGTAPRGQHHW